MNKALRKLNEAGVQKFLEYVDGGALDAPPVHLLDDPETSEELLVAIIPDRKDFKDRHEFGFYLNDLLKDLDPRAISWDAGLWSALALVWFDLICPPLSGGGPRKVRESHYYVFEKGYKTYYRHLVRSPWQCVRDHGDNARFMLVGSKQEVHPLAVHGEILESIGGRQRLLGSRPIVKAANAIYLDKSTGRPRTGVAGSGPGSARRFGKIVRQLDLTFDPEVMTVEQFIDILPKEFARWKKPMSVAKGTNVSPAEPSPAQQSLSPS